MRTRRSADWWLFWSAVSVLIYTYIGSPFILALRGLVRPKPVKRGNQTPYVSIIIAAYNEAQVIAQKIENTLALDYPRDKLEIIVASDGSDDGTNEIVARFASDGVRLFALPRQGKNQTLNTTVPQANGEILVFSDADSMLDREALRHLVAPFNDPDVGGVGGEHRYPVHERGMWDLKQRIKNLQSNAGTMTVAEGQIYAIRRELFREVPLTVSDDFYNSIQVPAAHRRLVFEPQAVAREVPAAGPQSAFRRKTRIITRWLHSMWHMRRLLNPFEYGFYALQLLSHKLMRRLVVLPVLVLGLTAPRLWQQSWFYKCATLGQLGLHLLAAFGYLLRNHRLGRAKPLRIPFHFDMVNAATLVALWRFIRGERRVVWEPQRIEKAGGNESARLAPHKVGNRNEYVAEAIELADATVEG